MRTVLDTSVLVAAVRSARGASRELLRIVLDGEFRPLVLVPLVLEYEAVLSRPEHFAGAVDAQANVEIVKAFCRMGEPVHIAHRLRPQLVDPDDEFVLEAAYMEKLRRSSPSTCEIFLKAARRFGIATLGPGEALERIRQQ
jgi:predicted nucleic acid-binding protein